MLHMTFDQVCDCQDRIIILTYHFSTRVSTAVLLSMASNALNKSARVPWGYTCLHLFNTRMICWVVSALAAFYNSKNKICLCALSIHLTSFVLWLWPNVNTFSREPPLMFVKSFVPRRMVEGWSNAYKSDIMATVNFHEDWLDLPCLAQRLICLHVSNYNHFWKNEGLLSFN